MKFFKRSKPIISDRSDSDDDDKSEKSLLNNQNKVKSTNIRRRAGVLDSSDSDNDSKNKCPASVSSSSSPLLLKPGTPAQESKQPYQSSTIAAPASAQKKIISII